MGLESRDNQLITGTPTLREGVLGFSRETGPIECTYGCGRVSVCLSERTGSHGCGGLASLQSVG